MTRDEWKRSADPTAMLTWLHQQGKLDERRARLFAVAVCRRIWELMPEKRSRDAVKIAERFADGEVGSNVLTAAHQSVMYSMSRNDPAGKFARANAQAAAKFASTDAIVSFVGKVVGDAQHAVAWSACADVDPYQHDVWKATFSGATISEQVAQAALVRDVFSPFRTNVLATSLLTSEIATLAQQAYDRRDFSKLPEIAAQLEAAGCQDTVLLQHLRGPGPHVRGCFALDLILGKS